MRRRKLIPLISIVTICILSPAALAQRGMGGPFGMGRQAVKPDLLTLNGTVQRVITEPCPMTTGRSDIGTHFILKTEQGTELNVHLGPADAVREAAQQLAVGKQVAVRAFRTDRMPEQHYNAVTIQVGDETIRLRNEETLQPFWARAGADRPGPGARGPMRPRQGAGWAAPGGRSRSGSAWEPGRANGRGRGWADCPRAGRGPGWGPGRTQAQPDRSRQPRIQQLENQIEQLEQRIRTLEQQAK